MPLEAPVTTATGRNGSAAAGVLGVGLLGVIDRPFIGHKASPGAGHRLFACEEIAVRGRGWAGDAGTPLLTVL